MNETDSAAATAVSANHRGTPALDNPLLAPWATPFEAPPFEAIAPEHFPPAFAAAMAEHRREVQSIAESRSEPSFANTIEALERSGRALKRVGDTFFNLCGAHTNEALQAIEREMSPQLARHWNAIYLDERLYSRIRSLWERRDGLGLSAEELRVLERYDVRFRRKGAGLDPAGKRRLAEIAERLAALGTQFSQNVLADEARNLLVLEGEADLDGLPDFVRAAAAQAASERGLGGKFVITTVRSSIEPFLAFSRRRDLREQAFHLWTTRGESGGATDTRRIITEILPLRAESARLLGYETFAHFRLDDTMAKTPQVVLDFLRSVWEPAVARARQEQEALQALVRAEGGNFALAPWDWRYYAEKRRRMAFDLDEAALKPFLQLDLVIEAAFDTATRLFGVTFIERRDVPRYHPDVRAFEVKARDGRSIGLFLGDYFARSSKHSGAWSSAYRAQQKLAGDGRPIIVNVMNFAKAEGGPTLLSFDDAKTLFHEFGHALHGLLSNVTYPIISGTSVLRDFVEFPSQIYEHWLSEPAVLRRFARHYQTGEPIPEALMERLAAAKRYNQGFETVEYLASALVDLDFHLLTDAHDLDVGAFERASLERIGMPEAIVMRHRPAHFSHVFSGEAYSASYYSYLWAEVLDADGFAAFKEAGDVFDPELAKRLHDHVYAAGGLYDPSEAYRSFRGRMPSPDAVLKQRGLIDG